MKIYKTSEMIQGENNWHKWRNGKFTSKKAISFFGFVAKTKSDYIEEAKENGIELPTKIVNAGKKNERVDYDIKVDELKDLVKEKLDKKFSEKKFQIKHDLLKLHADEMPQAIYDLIANKLSNGTAPTDETPIQRGHRLEPKIREWVNENYGYNFVEVGGLEREDEPLIANSPDGVEFLNDEIIEVAFEAKALSGGKHVKAYFTGKIPDEHFPQALQYFIVNDKLKKLVFVMGCPEITEFPYLKFEILREDIESEISQGISQQKIAVKIVNDLVKGIQF